MKTTKELLEEIKSLHTKTSELQKLYEEQITKERQLELNQNLITALNSNIPHIIKVHTIDLGDDTSETTYFIGIAKLRVNEEKSYCWVESGFFLVVNTVPYYDGHSTYFNRIFTKKDFEIKKDTYVLNNSYDDYTIKNMSRFKEVKDIIKYLSNLMEIFSNTITKES